MVIDNKRREITKEPRLKSEGRIWLQARYGAGNRQLTTDIFDGTAVYITGFF